MTHGASPEETSGCGGRPSVAAPVVTARSTWRERLMAALRVLGLLVLAVVSAYVYVRGIPVVGMPILLFVVSLAIAGRGNRWLWALIFPVLCGATGAAILGLYTLMPKGADFAMSLLAFVLVPVVPAAILGLAAKLKRVRSRRGTANTAIGEPHA